MNKQAIIATCGNILEHIDKALFVFLAPYLAQHFFSNLSPLISYGILFLPYPFFAKKIGAIFWGIKGDKKGSSYVYKIILFGLSSSIICMAFIPSYQSIGMSASLLLILTKSIFAFFSSGETTGSVLLLLSQVDKKQSGWISSIYEMSSMLGTLIGMFLVWIWMVNGWDHDYWQFLFLIAGTFGLICSFFAPQHTQRNNNSRIDSNTYKKPFNKRIFFFLVLIMGFSYANYEIIMTLMHLFFPIMQNISQQSMLEISGTLILIDMMLLPIFGRLSSYIGIQKQMIFSLYALILFSPLLYFLLYKQSIIAIFTLRFILVTIGVAFCAPLQAFAKELIGKDNAYLMLSLSKSFGSQLLGYPAISISIFAYNYFQSPFMFISYPLLLGIFCLIGFYLHSASILKEQSVLS